VDQSEWDRLLIESFYKRGDYPMYRLIPTLNGLGDIDAISHLKRVPEKIHLNYCVSRFVCGHLKKLGKLLWRTDISKIDQLVRVLGKSKLDTTLHPTDAASVREARIRSYEKKKYCNHEIKFMKQAKERAQQFGHEWKTVK